MNVIVIVFTVLITMIIPVQNIHPTERSANLNTYSHISEKIWKTEYQDSKIRIESAVITHTDKRVNIDHERIVFRYSNLSAKKIKLNFNRNLYYNGICYGCENTDKMFTVELGPTQSKEFSSENKDKTYYIFSKDLNGTIKKSLDKFELTNIEILAQ